MLRTETTRPYAQRACHFFIIAACSVMLMPADEFWDAADGYLVRAAGFIGHVQRLDEPWGPTRSMAGTIQLWLRPLADWRKDCAGRFDGRNVS